MTKCSPNLIIQVCEEFLSGKYSQEEICCRYGITYNARGHTSIINDWIPRFIDKGNSAFIRKAGNSSYSSIFKKKVVDEYLAGEGSLRDIAAKYNIPGKETVRKWVLLYNANRELKDYNPKREVYMAEARRKTTIEERKEIVEYCLQHNRNYKGTASMYGVSYSQVYSCVKKYDANG